MATNQPLSRHASASEIRQTREEGSTRQRRKVNVTEEKSSEELLNKQTKTSRRPKSRSLWKRFTRFSAKHHWIFPLIPLVAFVIAYSVNPTESNIVHRFMFLSYKQEETAKLGHGQQQQKEPQYGKGPWDFAFVSFYTIFLTFTREIIMQELLRPLAKRCGIKAAGKQLRFMEQMYTVIYFAVMGPAGLYVMHKTKAPELWYFNIRGMFKSFPHKTHDMRFKFYYLFEAAYWAQQMLVMLLGLEKPRKDFKELVMHHVVTLALIGLSYRFHFTYMGLAVYITHDVSDFFLALAKSLQYTNSIFVTPAFATCIATWIYLRHYLNLRILGALLPGGEFQTVGPYELNWDTEQYKCWISNIITFSLLACLQALNLFWLYCLGRSAYKFVVYRVAKDDRSEDEEDEQTEAQGQAQGEGKGKSKVSEVTKVE